MAKKDNTKASSDATAVLDTTKSKNAPYDATSQFSKETTSSTKNKGWARSLKKATNSILYMAMPPTSADHVPMVVAQTPMSPDRLIPSLHSPILQSPLLTTAVSSDSMVVSPVAPGPFSPTATLTSAPLSSVSVTAASSSVSVTTSSIASSAAGGGGEKGGSTRNQRETPALETPISHHKQQSSSSSNSSKRSKRSSKGKERAVPLSPEVLESLETPTGPLDYNGTDYSTLLASPPSSPLSKQEVSDSFTTAAALEATLCASTTVTKEAENKETLPSPPPSPPHVEEEETEVIEEEQDIEYSTLDREISSLPKERELLPMFPSDLASFDVISDLGHGRFEKPVQTEAKAYIDTERMQDVKSVSEKKATPSQILAPVQGIRQDIVVATMEEYEIQTTPAAEVTPIPAVQDFRNGVVSAPLVIPREAPSHVASLPLAPPAPGHNKELTFSEPIKNLPPMPPSPTDKKFIKPRLDAAAAAASSSTPVPPRSLSLARSLSKDTTLFAHQQKPQPIKNAPWLWHQDGITHQRLESHQILTKEQVFEQFHLDLEQDGPNGFFLFKLVKRFKRQDSSLLAISSSLLDAEISASPSSSPTNNEPTPTSILESIDAVSVSQRLKRQLLLQKRKKQRGGKSSTNESEEDENLEALMSMSNNNTSLQNLNSSLQDVLDAVDSLKETQDWGSLLDHPLDHSRTSSIYSQPSKEPHAPDSDNEYTSKDKDAMDIDALERKRGVYATGRTDGQNLISKKRLKALERRASVSGSAGSRKTNGGSNSGPIPTPLKGGHDSTEAGSEGADGSSATQPFKKQAVSQLHIYSRNGLKFKFDVMLDNELHFVEASKKYTFMDPLAAHRQPDLDTNSQDALSPLRSNSTASSSGLPPLNKDARRTSSGQISTVSTISSDGKSTGPRRRNTQSSTGSSSSNPGRRVFVTRLGRHTLLTYAEYKVLAKSASGFTLGAKLLIQRSIAVATPGFYGSSSNGQSNGHSREAASYGSDNEYSSVSPTSASFGSQAHSTPTTTGGAESADYFSAKKSKSRTLPGFASKAVAAIKSPQSGKTSRPIVTPYNPAEYKNKSLSVTVSTPATEDSSTPSPLYTQQSFDQNRRPSSASSGAMDIPWSDSSFPLPPHHQSSMSPSEQYSTSPPASSAFPLPAPSTPGAVTATPPPTPAATSTSSSSSSSNPYNSTPIKRQGNQAGIKFQHLFVTVHQRLQKLELDNGASFYRSALVQWTVIEDLAELRWWRDKIGIQMIGRLEGDPWPRSSTTLNNGGTNGHRQSQDYGSLSSSTMGSPSSSNPMYSSTLSVRSSYVSAQSTISDASSSSSLSVVPSAGHGYKPHISVERLGYRFLRVSGHMGTLKVTVSEQVEARAVALAVKAEMLKQKKRNQQQDGVYQEPAEDDYTEQPWVEVMDIFDEEEFEDDDEELDRHHPSDYEDEDERAGVDGLENGHNGVPIQQKKKKAEGQSYQDVYEYDEWTGQSSVKKSPPLEDRFSRRKRHDRIAKMNREIRKSASKQNGTRKLPPQPQSQGPLIERMTMIVGQTKVFKGDWYMKNIYKSY
ncbi:hypothetical protein BGZ83_011743 [Gryganskiella cystojenkinii]|nr:hypothetical protein BGZ83_011743 [Gryganskiella cystojenkinii]